MCGPEQRSKKSPLACWQKCITISNTLNFPHLNPRSLLALLYENNVLSKSCLYSGESNVNLSSATGQKSIPHKGVSNESINVSTEFHIYFLLTGTTAHVDEFKAVHVVATKDCNRPFSLSVITRTERININWHGSMKLNGDIKCFTWLGFFFKFENINKFNLIDCILSFFTTNRSICIQLYSQLKLTKLFKWDGYIDIQGYS